ncbi:hypothetical protein MPSEU_000735800 [Mayamaea pseudoterrestris]|nr:hypothetical protein MPSEU_000735800 [Mayamaea pseudoterrestris]
MPHPLETTLDVSFHRKPPARRRSSLDNSNLSAEGAVKERLALSHHADDTRKQRRPSLPDGITLPITFLAYGTSRPKVDLDFDLHTSAHSRSKRTMGAAQSRRSLLQRDLTNGTKINVVEDEISEIPSPTAVTNSIKAGEGEDDSDKESDLSSHSSDENDSFCDASVMEQANEEYIKQDLGASCFWSDAPGSDLGDDDFQMDDEELQRHLVEIITEEGLEEGMEAADAAALAEALKGLTSS